jgi:membrane-associated phospholipid phosphatase
MQSPGDAGPAAIQYLQVSPPWLFLSMLAFSLIGSPVASFFFIAALYWCCDVRLGLRAALLLGISAGVNDALKIAFHTPRPSWTGGPPCPLVAESTFAFPSAHAQLAAGFWGYLAASVRRFWLSVSCALLILLIGASRVYLGVHTPLDVVAGWIIGLLILALFLLLEPAAARLVRGWTLSRRLAAAWLVSLLIPAATICVLATLDGWQVPEAWLAAAFRETGQVIDPLSPANSFLAGGVFFGFAAGMAWYLPRACPLCPAPAGVHLVRYLAGVAGVLLIWFGQGLPAPPGEAALLAITYLQGALLGLWITAGAPLLFCRLLPGGCKKG